jgi:hypothetical protein
MVQHPHVWDSDHPIAESILAPALRDTPPEAQLAENENDNLTVVPIPASETQAEHDRIRKSNDRDQRLDRDGKPSRHNRGYDEAADGPKTPEIDRIVDE